MTVDSVLVNALHAAGVWLQRMSLEGEVVVEVCISPRAAVGFWMPGLDSVQRLPTIEDPERELLEAVAPAAQQALERLDAQAQATAIAAAARGGRLRLLAAPSTGEIALHIDDGRRDVELCAVIFEPVQH